VETLLGKRTQVILITAFQLTALTNNSWIDHRLCNQEEWCIRLCMVVFLKTTLLANIQFTLKLKIKSLVAQALKANSKHRIRCLRQQKSNNWLSRNSEVLLKLNMELFKTLFQALIERLVVMVDQNNYQRNQTLTERKVNKAYTKQWDKDKYFTEDQLKNERLIIY
jgi:hypothetical protein